MEKMQPEDKFRRDLRSFTQTISSIYGLVEKKSIPISDSETIDIDPSFNYGVIIRLISSEDVSENVSSFSLVLRRSADIDLLDENLRYIPIESVDRFEASRRIAHAKEALNNVSDI